MRFGMAVACVARDCPGELVGHFSGITTASSEPAVRRRSQ
jgi:hypothetical protein